MSDLKPCPHCGGRGEIEIHGSMSNCGCLTRTKHSDLSARIIARADQVLALPVSDTFADGFREAWREARLMALDKPA